MSPPRNFIHRSNEICRQVMVLQEVSKVTSIHLNRPLTQRLGPSRCFPFWQELLACYVVNTNTEDISGGKKCLPAMDDYYECLHHRKEVSCPVTLNQVNHRSMWLIKVIIGSLPAGKDKIITDCIPEEGVGISAREYSKSRLNSEPGVVG